MTDKTGQPSYPISHLLKSIKGRSNQGLHNLQLYAAAFDQSEFQALSVVAVGKDAVVIKLVDGTIMKITTRTFIRSHEPFDIPVLDSGERVSDGRSVKYFIQPEAFPPTREDFVTFLKTLARQGFRMTDPGIDQIGIYQGQIFLLDPYAVDRT